MEPKKFLANDEIKARRVIVIDVKGEKLGEFLRNDALKLAEERDLDLVQVEESEKPVCRLMDYGKFLYDQKKKAKKNAANSAQQAVELKEIQLSFQTEQDYINIKSQQARKFLSRGDRVKLVIKFSGRESAHMNLIYGKCRSFFDSLSDISDIESPPRIGERQVHMILCPKK